MVWISDRTELPSDIRFGSSYFGATEMTLFGFGLFDLETVSKPRNRNRITLGPLARGT